MKHSRRYCFALILMHIIGASTLSRAADAFSLEPWVNNCTIVSADLLGRDARAVAGGISMQKHGNWGWSPRLQSAEGVLVVHPVSKSKPAEIKFRIPAPRLGAAKYTQIVLKARGSDYQPGVSIMAVAREKILREIMVGREWGQMVIAMSQLPKDTDEVVFKIRPLQWEFEYCYIDFIAVK